MIGPTPGEETISQIRVSVAREICRFRMALRLQHEVEAEDHCQQISKTTMVNPKGGMTASNLVLFGKRRLAESYARREAKSRVVALHLDTRSFDHPAISQCSTRPCQ